MNVVKMTPEQWPRWKQGVLRFLARHGDRRITLSARQWLRALHPAGLLEPGTEIWMSIDNRKLIGVSAFGRYGIDQSLIAVHRDWRNRGVGEALVRRSLQSLGKLYARVALDNTASLKLCFAMNMVAFHWITGPTGKPTLWLGGGDWRREDIIVDPVAPASEGDPVD